jgi:hypothetical protein
VDTPTADADVIQPAAVVDATAELLGRANPRRSRVRTSTTPRKTAGKKTGSETVRRTPRRSRKGVPLVNGVTEAKEESAD